MRDLPDKDAIVVGFFAIIQQAAAILVVIH